MIQIYLFISASMDTASKARHIRFLDVSLNTETLGVDQRVAYQGSGQDNITDNNM